MPSLTRRGKPRMLPLKTPLRFAFLSLWTFHQTRAAFPCFSVILPFDTGKHFSELRFEVFQLGFAEYPVPLAVREYPRLFLDAQIHFCLGPFFQFNNLSFKNFGKRQEYGAVISNRPRVFITGTDRDNEVAWRVAVIASGTLWR